MTFVVTDMVELTYREIHIQTAKWQMTSIVNVTM